VTASFCDLGIYNAITCGVPLRRQEKADGFPDNDIITALDVDCQDHVWIVHIGAFSQPQPSLNSHSHRAQAAARLNVVDDSE